MSSSLLRDLPAALPSRKRGEMVDAINRR